MIMPHQERRIHAIEGFESEIVRCQSKVDELDNEGCSGLNKDVF